MNLSKEIAAKISGLDYERLNSYLRDRREKLRDKLEQQQEENGTAFMRGQLFEINELLKLEESVRISLSSENNH